MSPGQWVLAGTHGGKHGWRRVDGEVWGWKGRSQELEEIRD